MSDDDQRKSSLTDDNFSTDQVIQETPVAEKLFPVNKQFFNDSYSKDGLNLDKGASVNNIGSSRIITSPFQNPAKALNASEMFPNFAANDNSIYETTKIDETTVDDEKILDDNNQLVINIDEKITSQGTPRNTKTQHIVHSDMISKESMLLNEDNTSKNNNNNNIQPTATTSQSHKRTPDRNRIQIFFEDNNKINDKTNNNVINLSSIAKHINDANSSPTSGDTVGLVREEALLKVPHNKTLPIDRQPNINSNKPELRHSLTSLNETHSKAKIISTKLGNSIGLIEPEISPLKQVKNHDYPVSRTSLENLRKSDINAKNSVVISQGSNADNFYDGPSDANGNEYVFSIETQENVLSDKQNNINLNENIIISSSSSENRVINSLQTQQIISSDNIFMDNKSSTKNAKGIFSTSIVFNKSSNTIKEKTGVIQLANNAYDTQLLETQKINSSEQAKEMIEDFPTSELSRVESSHSQDKVNETETQPVGNQIIGVSNKDHLQEGQNLAFQESQAISQQKTQVISQDIIQNNSQSLTQTIRSVKINMDFQPISQITEDAHKQPIEVESTGIYDTKQEAITQEIAIEDNNLNTIQDEISGENYSNRIEVIPVQNPNLTLSSVIEVPGTSPSSKFKEARSHINDQESSPVHNIGRIEVNDLPMSTPQIFIPQISRNQTESNSDSNNSVEEDSTQELPEVEDENQENMADKLHKTSTFGDRQPSQYIIHESQEVITNRRKLKRKTTEVAKYSLEDNPEQFNTTPRKHLKREAELQNNEEKVNVFNDSKESKSFLSNTPELKKLNMEPDSSNIPTDIKTEDNGYLSENDIKFSTAVWSLFERDMNYYPGRILKEISTDTVQVSFGSTFEISTEFAQYNDIYYLDIRIGDIVVSKMIDYEVVGLEACLKEDNQNIIRCIRGYDTVHLQKYPRTGNDKITIKYLSDIHIDINHWARRPKIILGNLPHTRKNAMEDVRYPIRGRHNTSTHSPRKSRQGTPRKNLKISNERIDSSLGEMKNYRTLTKLDIFITESLNKFKNLKKNIFENCLFSMSKNDLNDDNFKGVIKQFGGKLLDNDNFSTFFMYRRELSIKSKLKWHEYDLFLTWEKKYKDIKFVCSFFWKYQRTQRYLEALALKWPILHPNFIIECIKQERLCHESMFKYLLPSGLSARLSDKEGIEVIKSNNIYQFYSNYINNYKINEQNFAMKDIMGEYYVLLYGKSDWSDLFTFLFACLGIEKLFHLENHDLNLINNKIIEIINTCNMKNKKLLIFIDGGNTGLSNCDLEILRQELIDMTIKSNITVHVEDKEWLVQTLINEDTGFES
ncbi:hypothetical protein TBLA_0H00650 [Henningerozyma blattae CBS 6284]|uniref:BRCT domain-containing protein n=1 Tax=Henningerozyma blattae (strain ATCC 34711 / CBS 6284 / DSM 70876 / NBRC 10599 / NRRL Y-10934 / UCD 77-7) TaxID=1071380 RepID=I2H7K4_HENB6|nr:hypothetical protein TBLA_0H00650 [Tetrapisispora blattae CBS 6284]CCH62356.1 hypothetical protein TBLA_0H00650 [Tetrapisispora blattae CBS 6284]